MGRTPCCDKAKVKRGPWSPEEDATLKDYLEKHGNGGNWISLPMKAGLKRCGKSCRLRWLNYLRPDIKHGGFTEEEDAKICSLYSSLGSRWSVIASQLPGRTDNDVKNYWNTKLKKKLNAKAISPKTSSEESNPTAESTEEHSHRELFPTSSICDYQHLHLNPVGQSSSSVSMLQELTNGGGIGQLSGDPSTTPVNKNFYTPLQGCSSWMRLEDQFDSIRDSVQHDDSILLDYGFEPTVDTLHGLHFYENYAHL